MILLLCVMALATLLGAFGAFFLKLGSAHFSLHPLKLLRNWQFLLGGCLYAASIPVYLFVLSRLPLSITYPLTSMQYIWVFLLSAIFLKERVHIWRWAGVCLIIGGITLLSL
ncbi:MAG: EamA family transporter [Candidatus Woesearchaeota archaeon]|nr:EamA family transporter [Candidatus Woesearchaeota archaeon]